MTIRGFVQAALTMGVVFVMAASASAGTITYNTSAAGSEFVLPSVGLTLSSTSGDAGTITFTPITSAAISIPSNISLGEFKITCATCTASGGASTFGSFTFDLVFTDVTDGATGEFVGTSAGGTVSYNSSSIDIVWAPLVLGPGTINALTGNFGATYVTTTTPTPIVALNTNTGTTSVQGYMGSSPEPATLSLIGGGLVGLGLLRRKRLSRG